MRSLTSSAVPCSICCASRTFFCPSRKRLGLRRKRGKIRDQTAAAAAHPLLQAVSEPDACAVLPVYADLFHLRDEGNRGTRCAQGRLSCCAAASALPALLQGELLRSRSAQTGRKGKTEITGQKSRLSRFTGASLEAGHIDQKLIFLMQGGRSVHEFPQFAAADAH